MDRTRQMHGLPPAHPVSRNCSGVPGSPKVRQVSAPDAAVLRMFPSGVWFMVHLTPDKEAAVTVSNGLDVVELKP